MLSVASLILALLVVRSGSINYAGGLSTLHVGEFSIETARGGQSLNVLFGSKPVAVLPFSRVTCYPATSNKSIIIPVFEQLICVNNKGERLWNKDLDYFFNPSRLVTTGQIVVADEGPMSVGARSTYKSRGGYYLAIQKAFRTMGLSAKTGETVWNHQNAYAGVPVVSLGADRILCASMTSSDNHFLDGQELVLNELREDGKRSVCWRAFTHSNGQFRKAYYKLTNGFVVPSVRRHGMNIIVTLQDAKSIRKSKLSLTISQKKIVLTDGCSKILFWPTMRDALGARNGRESAIRLGVARSFRQLRQHSVGA